MTHRILILGGTTEARQLAARLAARGDLDITLSLAGRTENPVEQPVPIRTGGFGGAQGLADWLAGHKTDVYKRQANACDHHGFTQLHCVTGIAGRQPVIEPTGAARETCRRNNSPPSTA